MGFRLVGGIGNVENAVITSLYGSGTIHQNGVIVFNDALNVVSAPPASGTGVSAFTTNIVGVSLDGVVGASDTLIRVILFNESQLWEVDCVNTVTTANLYLRHQLASDTYVRNISSVSETASSGVFFSLGVSSGSTGSGKLIGKFLTRNMVIPSSAVSANAPTS